MDAVAITIGVAWIAAGLLSIGLAIPLLHGKVGPNGHFGIRFRECFQSNEAWFAINRYGAKRMITWALPMIVIGVATLFIPLQTRPMWALLFGLVPLAFVLIPVLSTWKYARRYTEGP
jgi:SdpI/YfhL protein family